MTQDLTNLISRTNKLLGVTQEHDAETVDRVAAAIWRAETVDAGTPESVTMRRTPQMFRDLGETNRAKWIKYARAAIAAMLERDVTVQESIDHACAVIDAFSEYDQNECCDGRECGCYGSSVHEHMKHQIRALSGEKP